MKRREFIKKAAVGTGSLAALSLCDIIEQNRAYAFPTSGGMGIEEALFNLERGKERNIIPEIRPEIKNNPRAVFLIKTHVDAQTDANGHFTASVSKGEIPTITMLTN